MPGPHNKAVRVWVLAAVALIGSVLLGIVLWADSWTTGMLVASPSPAYAPGRLPAGAEALEVQRAGAQVRAWLLEPSQPARGTLFLLHGIGDSKLNHMGVARAHVARGLRAVVVDSRGHGESSGAYLTYGVQESRDLVALIDALAARQRLSRPLIVRGTSYGAATAIQLAAIEPRVDSVVALAPFASLREVVPAYVDWLLGPVAALVPQSWLDDRVGRAARRAGFDPDAACPRCVAPKVRASVLLVHSRDDERIPHAHSIRIREALTSRSELMLVDGVGHVAVGAGPGVAARVQRWLEEALQGP